MTKNNKIFFASSKLLTQFSYLYSLQNRFTFTGECRHREQKIHSCQNVGSQFLIANQKFNITYKECQGMSWTKNKGGLYHDTKGLFLPFMRIDIMLVGQGKIHFAWYLIEYHFYFQWLNIAVWGIGLLEKITSLPQQIPKSQEKMKNTGVFLRIGRMIIILALQLHPNVIP